MEQIKRGNRRYRIEQNKVYNDMYDLQMLQSPIFNTDDTISVHTILFDKKNIQSEIFRYHGDDKGMLNINGSPYRAYIPAMQDELNKLALQWERMKIQMVNEGFAEPEEMPEDMLNRKYEFEARLDVREKELLELEKRLASFTDEEKNTDNANMLKFGLMGEGRLQGGILVEIDSQKVVQHKAGHLIIANGKFAGMSVPDYRKLITSWQEFRKEEDSKKLIKWQEEAKAEGKKFVEEEYSRYDSVSFGGGRPVSSNLLPDWPEGVRNWNNEDEEEDN